MKTYLVARREELKKRQNKGFTLMEMLIVVAIIAVLIAIAIPVFTAQLEKAREETDLGNLRGCKAIAVSTYMLADHSDTSVTWNSGNDGFTAYYDIESGKLTTASPAKKYGAGTTTVGNASNTDFGYDPATAYTDKVIKVTVDAAGECTFAWE